MKKTKKIIFILALLVVLIISGCAKKPTETPEVIVPGGNLGNTSWITEPIQATQSDLTIELLHVAVKDDKLVLRVKFPIPDWRKWYISSVKLTVADEASYTNAQTEFFERLYQKGINTYCLYQPSYNEEETCLTSDSMETYQIDSLIFSDLPEGFESKQIVLEILELATSATYCEDLRIPYIEEILSKDFPGLTLECAAGKNANTYAISAASGFADNPEAQQSVQALVDEAANGNVAGPWRFEISK